MNTLIETYSKYIWLDSNVILEGLWLAELPWHDIDATGPILILIAPAVLREVDSKKKDGRLAVRAREFNRLIGPVAVSGLPIRVSEQSPKVDLMLASCKKIDWEQYDDLVATEGDARLIAEALNVKEFPVHELLVVSQDIQPLTMAQRHGLKCFHIPTTWLGKAELSPLEKENSRLKKEIAEYKKTEPEFHCDFQTLLSQPIQIQRVAPLTESDVANLTDEILAANPQAPQSYNNFGGVGSLLNDYDHTLDQRYEKFEQHTVPDFVRTLHTKLEVTFGQVPFKFELKNVGVVPAEHIRVEIQVVGGWLHSRPILSGTYPNAPKPKTRFDRDPIWRAAVSVPNRSVGRHEFEISELNRSTQITILCTDFRKGNDAKLTGVLWVDPHHEGDVVVIVKATAANHHKTYSRIIKIAKSVVDVGVFDLIERPTGRAKIHPHTKELIEAALEHRDYSAFEFENTTD